jgi:hypothetical protein
MPHQNTGHDELLAIRRQDQDLAQARHAMTRRQVREQEKLLVALRQSRMAADARLRWAEEHNVGHLDAGEVLTRIGDAIANARRQLESLRAHLAEEERDLAEASQRAELAEGNLRRQNAQIERQGYAIAPRWDGAGQKRKAA